MAASIHAHGARRFEFLVDRSKSARRVDLKHCLLIDAVDLRLATLLELLELVTVARHWIASPAHSPRRRNTVMHIGTVQWLRRVADIMRHDARAGHEAKHIAFLQVGHYRIPD